MLKVEPKATVPLKVKSKTDEALRETAPVPKAEPLPAVSVPADTVVPPL
jgi:hypothetical protein